jgi:hypothetical protein
MKPLDNEVITRFVKLRAQGWTFTEINAELNVPKLTLIIWSRQYRPQIRYLWGFMAEVDEFMRLGRDETSAVPLLRSAATVPFDWLDCLVTRTFAVMDAVPAAFTGLTSELCYYFTAPMLPAPSSLLFRAHARYRGQMWPNVAKTGQKGPNSNL